MIGTNGRLVENKGRVFTYEQIYNKVREEDSFENDSPISISKMISNYGSIAVQNE